MPVCHDFPLATITRLTGDYIKLLLFVGCYLLQTTTNHQRPTKKRESYLGSSPDHQGASI
ncbi:hypothetical protein CEN46_00315 [Fischerella thermalis CCMEE 5318]|uniref:Uncharacterized protein n=1 Tax=Fischerella thermalis CCMEE 5318 TaxID=2019666 RepID=A0A2N6LPV3_9CYAN|nr:hypothetical protein CEN46_00315 [Fischerella thermalis CCMEE 5318]